MEEKVSMNLPVKLNLFDMVTVRPYKDSPEYHEANRVFQKKIVAKKARNRILIIFLWLILAGLLLYLYFTGHTFLIWVAGIIGAIICFKISLNLSPSGIGSVLNTTKEDEETCKKIINELIATNFPGSRHIYSWGKALIYNNDVFSFMSMKENLLVVYSHSNFRQISWKEIDGSHEYGDLYDISLPEGGNIATIRYQGKGYKKELCVEISTNYMEYPIIKFAVPATKEFNEQIKIAGSILQ